MSGQLPELPSHSCAPFFSNICRTLRMVSPGDIRRNFLQATATRHPSEMSCTPSCFSSGIPGPATLPGVCGVSWDQRGLSLLSSGTHMHDSSPSADFNLLPFPLQEHGFQIPTPAPGLQWNEVSAPTLLRLRTLGCAGICQVRGLKHFST